MKENAKGEARARPSRSVLPVELGQILGGAVGRDQPPEQAGQVGLNAWAVVDEGLSLPTFTQYKPESHIRGLIGHSTWGITAGLLLSLTSR